MRALLTILAFLAPLLAGCERPAPSDYWTDPRTAAAANQPGAGEPRTFEKLMADGTRANLAGRPSEAKALFRQALKVQETRYGRGTPGTALPLMSLALQLSVEEQYPEADARFADAAEALRTSTDRALKTRLLHYRGVHMLNQKKPQEAEALLGAAQASYTAMVPEEALTRAPAPKVPKNRFDLNSGRRVGTSTNLRGSGGEQMIQPALLGLIEVMRYRAIALRDLQRVEEAETLTASAAKIAAGNGLGRASVFARVFRTAGVTASTRLLRERALDDLGHSDDAFEEALPGTKPSAEAKLIRAGELMRAGKTGAALSVCRRAVSTLISISAGTSPDLMAPCLDAYATGGLFNFGSGNRTDMFLAAQIAQGSITSHQIAQASASLAENARDPRIGEALKRRDTFQRELDRIYRALDTLGGSAASGRTAEQITQLQQQADTAQAGLVQAEADVRTLSPNYAQLVQDVVPARDVFATLRPNEAFVALFLSQRSGWAFALRNGDISVVKIEGGIDKIGPLVKAVRAGIELQASGPPVFDVDSTRQLYALTLGGIADKIRGAKSLVIAPTGPLLSLPFEVLLTGPANVEKLAEAPWLVREATITHVPAPTNFVSLRKVANTSKAAKKWFGFGDFHTVTPAQAQAGFPDRQCARDRAALVGLPALPGAAKELAGTQTILGASPNDELLGDRFTADQVMKEPLTNYQILHFAAHALLPTDLECQTEAAIVTSAPARSSDAKGWLLTSSRLLGLELDANLVILSACNSGGGDGKSGESLSGLARSFFFARARSLLVTHWPVNDVFASALVRLTVASLQDKPGLGVTGALRDAQLELLGKMRSGDIAAGYAHPFYWAPFAVIGEGGEGSGRSTVSSSQ